MQDALRRYESAVRSGERAKIVALVENLLDDGMTPLDLLTEVVAPAQRNIGRRWQRGEWSIAQEHAATAMAMAATEIVSNRIAQPAVRRGHVLVTCAEREWHWLPAAIIGCTLREHGWQTTSLGPATSPMRLSQYIQDLGPDAVAVSCSVLGAMSTTRRFIETSTSAGVPVVVGGAAFGGDDMRARALGATAWAPDARGAVDAVAGLPVVVSPVGSLPDAAAREQAALELDQQCLVDRLRQGWSVTATASDDDASPAAVRSAARDALPPMLHAVSAALLTGDPRPVSETVCWLADLLFSRGADPHVAVDELSHLLIETLADYPISVDLLRAHFSLDR